MTTKFSSNRSRVQPTPHVCRSLPPGVDRSTAQPGTWYTVTLYAPATTNPPQPAAWAVGTLQLNDPDKGPATAIAAPASASARIELIGERQTGSLQCTITVNTTTTPTDGGGGGGGNDVATRDSPLPPAPPTPTIETWTVPIPPRKGDRDKGDVFATVASAETQRTARVSVTRA